MSKLGEDLIQAAREGIEMVRWMARESVAITPSDEWIDRFGPMSVNRPTILTDITYGNPHT